MARKENAVGEIDDGTRRVRIVGCDYKLLESEILDWLGLFGEVLSEIKEEIYEESDDEQRKVMPPVGNGNYLVTMRLSTSLRIFINMLVVPKQGKEHGYFRSRMDAIVLNML